ncbi:hypothetical protein MHU86_5810 [Fragilaria crotonensis]|nr:hypothetical protein MHU86_5810 [Fragilaria crotonensis]
MPSEQHIFIFRHCLRSTPSYVDLYDNRGPLDVSVYWNQSPPAWNVATEWCTEQGLHVLERTVMWLATQNPQLSLLVNTYDDTSTTTTTDTSSVKIRILADTSQRDVDSALAFSDALRSLGIDINCIELDPTLFRPPPVTSNCPAVNQSMIPLQLQKRLDTIPPPTTLKDALLIMDTLVQFKQPFPDNATSTIRINNNKQQLEGPVNLVKLLAQMLLYSRASSIDFLPNATMSQISTLVPWIAWHRTIQDAFQSNAARQGSIMAKFIHKQLKQQHDQHDQNNVTNVMFVFGHDTDLNALQTVLNVEWSLPWYGLHSPTPPSTAMHFHQDSNTGTITVDLLYPTYYNDGNEKDPTGITNTSGILEKYPLRVFQNHEEFKTHIEQQLASFQVAASCFTDDDDHVNDSNTTAAIPIPNNNYSSSSSSDCQTLEDYYMGWLTGMSLALLLLSVLLFLQRCKTCRPTCSRICCRSSESTAAYTPAATTTTTMTSVELL